MANQTITAVVLRHANYKDNDKMLTLFSSAQGRVDVLSRGCRRPRSPLMGASEMFCTGEFLLFTNQDRSTLTSCTIHDSFFPLRQDIDKLSRGVYLLNLCEVAIQPGEPAPDLFRLLIKTLHCLCYGQQDDRALLSLFLLHYANLIGYKPRLMHCVHCGQRLSPETAKYFDLSAGGLVCQECEKTKSSVLLSPGQSQWLQQALHTGPEDTDTLLEGLAPFPLLRSYVEGVLERPIKSGAMLHL